MADDDDHAARLAAISVPEMRRRVNLAVGYLRELRRALAVHAGMVKEQVPGPIPELDPDQAHRAFAEIMDLLPVRRTLLTPEERAKLRVVTPRERELMQAALDELVDHPEAPEELGLSITHEKIVELRDGLVKTEMLVEVEREVSAFAQEVGEYKQHLADSLAAAGLALRGRPRS